MGQLFKVQVQKKHMSGVDSSMMEYYAVRADSGKAAIDFLKAQYFVTDENCQFEKINPMAPFLVDLSNADMGSAFLYSITIE